MNKIVLGLVAVLIIGVVGVKITSRHTLPPVVMAPNRAKIFPLPPVKYWEGLNRTMVYYDCDVAQTPELTYGLTYSYEGQIPVRPSAITLQLKGDHKERLWKEITTVTVTYHCNGQGETVIELPVLRNESGKVRKGPSGQLQTEFVGEHIESEVPIDTFVAMAQATEIEIQIGDTIFPLKEPRFLKPIQDLVKNIPAK